MRVYVATKWEERARAQEVMEDLVNAGHIIAYDWTKVEQASRAQALYDLEGVMKADAFVLVLEKELPLKGAWVEFGAAAARGIPIFVLGPPMYGASNIFMQLPTVHRVFSVTDILRHLSHITSEMWATD